MTKPEDSPVDSELKLCAKRPRRTLAPFVMQLPGSLREIHCPRMELFVWRDGQPPVLLGTGSLQLSDPTALRWTMMVADDRSGEGLKALARLQEFPYDERCAMRLEATDCRGVHWSCGWVSPEIQPGSSTHLRLQGALDRLDAMCSGELVAKDSSIELYFDPPPSLPLSETLVTSMAIGKELVGQRFEAGREVRSVLGSTIEVSRDPFSDGLWLVANTTAELPHPYFENWASEPLRVLCGQLIYPRLVARNFGDNTAAVWIRRTFSLRSNVGGLRAGFDGPDALRFWSFYDSCLTFLAHHRDADGQPKFGANLLSRFHEEVIQAAGSSDWVLALAASSAIEGMSQLATKATALPKDFDDDEITAARKHLQCTPGPPALRDRLVSNLAYMGQPSVRKFLGVLVEQQVISASQRDAWVAVRNKVAHGRLDGTGSAPGDDRNLVKLLELLNALTKHVVITKE